MTVIKRDRKDSAQDLVTAIDKLNPLLAEQGEHDAVADLKKIAGDLKRAQLGTDPFKAAVDALLDAFEGDHELIAYTHQRKDSSEWTPAEELAIASCRVLNLARRMKS
jgi:signal transduction histidine kinase